jgi:hypothetical protein
MFREGSGSSKQVRPTNSKSSSSQKDKEGGNDKSTRGSTPIAIGVVAENGSPKKAWGPSRTTYLSSSLGQSSRTATGGGKGLSPQR